MKKLLYVAPHLSTGGLPQYLTKKLELLQGEFELYLVEWVDHTGGVLVVQKNRIQNLIDKDKFFTLGENKHELIDIISRVKPDIIHLEEIPEYFMDFEVASQVYNVDRDYAIVETSHDSSYDTTQKKFFPDKFIFVSEWQVQQYKDIDIPKTVAYYPIDYIERPNREEALISLGLDPNKKHILHVGLFTPRKNQKEFFEYAKFLPEYEFHSVGNQADNFKHYWEPLMKDKPDNLTWWNERNDVERFYQAMDLFLFTSRGTNTDKETMPLVIREAVSNQIPTLIYNLPVYLDYWDDFKGVDYLDFSDFGYNCKAIINALETKPVINPKDEVFIISTYPLQQSVIDATKDCILGAKQSGRQVILTSHAPIPEELQELADYCVYDKNNILTKHNFYKSSWAEYEHFKAEIYLPGEDNDVYHGPAVYTNYYNGVSLAKALGFRKAYFLNYDYILENPEFIDEVSSILNKKLAYADVRELAEGKTSSTFFTAIDIDFYLKTHPKISTAEEYDGLKDAWGSLSNGYENLYYFCLKPYEKRIHFEDSEAFADKIKQNFKHLDFSRIEYITLLPTTSEEHVALYYLNSNAFDSKDIVIKVIEDGEVTAEEIVSVEQQLSWFRLFPKNSTLEFSIEAFDKVTSKLVWDKNIHYNEDYMNTQLSINGLLTLK